jgi:hypothetical protein
MLWEKNVGMADTSIVQYIIRGLCSADLRQVVVASCPTDIGNLMQKVRFYKSVIVTADRDGSSSTLSTTTTTGMKNTVRQPETSQPKRCYRRDECYNWFQTGYIACECSNPARKSTCNIYQKVGHMSSACPNARSGGLVRTIKMEDNYQNVVINGRLLLTAHDFA